MAAGADTGVRAVRVSMLGGSSLAPLAVTLALTLAYAGIATVLSEGLLNAARHDATLGLS